MKKPKPPKLWLRYAAAVALLTAIIYSCKKDQNLTTTNLTPDQTTAKMQDWLNKQKTDSITALTVNNLLSDADWKTAHTVAADSGKAYMIVRLNYLPAFDDPAKTEQRYLTLLVQNGATTGYIYDIYGNKADLTMSTDNQVTTFNQNTMPGFTGEITLSTWKNAVKEYKSFTNGAMVKHSKISNQGGTKSKTIQSAKKVNACIDWYWATWDADGYLTSAEYLYTECDGSGDQGGCGGGGSGGGPPEGPQTSAYRDSKGIMKVKLNCGGSPNDPTPQQKEITKEQCSEKQLVSVRAANSVIDNLGSAVYDRTQSGSEQGLEHAANETLSDWKGGNNYVQTDIAVGGTDSVRPKPFTWNDSQGYTIGYVHSHPNDTAPSPSDVYEIIANANTSSDLKAAGADAMNFYKGMAHVTSETSTGNYTVTIADWDAASQILNSNSMDHFNIQYKNFYDEYRYNNPDQSAGDASAYALSQIFGSSINIYSAPFGSTAYKPLNVTTDTNGCNPQMIPTQCPTN